MSRPVPSPRRVPSPRPTRVAARLAALGLAGLLAACVPAAPFSPARVTVAPGVTLALGSPAD